MKSMIRTQDTRRKKVFFAFFFENELAYGIIITSFSFLLHLRINNAHRRSVNCACVCALYNNN